MLIHRRINLLLPNRFIILQYWTLIPISNLEVVTSAVLLRNSDLQLVWTGKSEVWSLLLEIGTASLGGVACVCVDLLEFGRWIYYTTLKNRSQLMCISITIVSIAHPRWWHHISLSRHTSLLSYIQLSLHSFLIEQHFINFHCAHVRVVLITTG